MKLVVRMFPGVTFNCALLRLSTRHKGLLLARLEGRSLLTLVSYSALSPSNHHALPFLIGPEKVKRGVAFSKARPFWRLTPGVKLVAEYRKWLSPIPLSSRSTPPDPLP